MLREFYFKQFFFAYVKFKWLQYITNESIIAQSAGSVEYSGYISADW